MSKKLESHLLTAKSKISFFQNSSELLWSGESGGGVKILHPGGQREEREKTQQVTITVSQDTNFRREIYSLYS